ncbi:hypothetical protein [Gallaecimonas sp. GXIMD4217]|uniref:hypothetical protein n=1 Tax=Gallaecimonas sp. GXIMD4217 TaxID=3131927 RepID=UPI00311ACCD5
MRNYLIAAALVGLVGCASTDEPAQGQAVAQNQESGNKLVCESEKKTGTRLRKRRCVTAKQREEERRRAERLVDELGQQRTIEAVGQ